MAKRKQYVFSARTTEEGLKALNELKAQRGVSWDELVIGAVYTHYGLDRDVMALPKAEKPAKPTKKSKTKQKGGEDGSDKRQTGGR